MTAVAVCRKIAHKIWNAERASEPFGVHGLNSHQAVRERLHKIALEIGSDGDSLRIDFVRDAPPAILERTEWLLGSTDLPQSAVASMQRMLIVQCIAARLGLWAPRGAEIADARTAQLLLKDLGGATWGQYRVLNEVATELERTRRFREAAASLLEADRLVRTAAGLQRAAIMLTRAGEYISGLWTIRACLLERRSAFDSRTELEAALRLEKRLRAVVEGRMNAPLRPGEAELFLTGDKGWEEEPTAELIERPARRLPPPPPPPDPPTERVSPMRLQTPARSARRPIDRTPTPAPSPLHRKLLVREIGRNRLASSGGPALPDRDPVSGRAAARHLEVAAELLQTGSDTLPTELAAPRFPAHEITERIRDRRLVTGAPSAPRRRGR